MDANKKSALVLAIQGLTIIGIAIAPYFEHGQMDFSLSPSEWHKTIGTVINACGFVFLVLCLRAMGKSLRAQPKPNAAAGLVQAWPFGWVRNPIYFVGLILGLGWSISFLSLWSLLLTVLLYFVLRVKISLEEQFLLEAFGDEYLEYMKRVPRLFPFSRPG